VLQQNSSERIKQEKILLLAVSTIYTNDIVLFLSSIWVNNAFLHLTLPCCNILQAARGCKKDFLLIRKPILLMEYWRYPNPGLDYSQEYFNQLYLFHSYLKWWSFRPFLMTIPPSEKHPKTVL